MIKMKNKINKIWLNIKNKFNKLIDLATLKAENKLLKDRVKELEKQHQPLIDLKNKYLSELRVTKMQLAKYKKKEGINEKIINSNNDIFNNRMSD